MMDAWSEMGIQKGDNMWLKPLVFFWALLAGLFLVRFVSERYRKYQAKKNSK